MFSSKSYRLVAAAALVGAGLVSTPAMAVPGSPPNAEVDHGMGCAVTADFITYTSDPTCRYTLVTRQDQNGNLVIFSYHDHGSLPEDADLPATAERNTVMFGGLECSEVVTPSGEYMSSCFYRP